MKATTQWLVQVTKLTLLMIFIVFASEVSAQSPNESKVSWISYSEAAELVEAEQKKMMIFLEAEWCTVCKRMHREVFTDEEVTVFLNSNFYPVKIDIESNDEIPVKGKMISKEDFSKSVEIYGTPTILFLNNEEDIIGNFVGYSDEKDMMRLLNYIKSEAYLNESLESSSYQ